MSNRIPYLDATFAATCQEVSLVYWEQRSQVLIIILAVLMQKLEVIWQIPHSNCTIFGPTQQHFSMLCQAINPGRVKSIYCGDFFEVTCLVINFDQVILLVCWLWRNCYSFVMQMKHGLNVIFSFNFRFLSKINPPVPSSPILLAFDVLLKFALHFLNLLLVTFTFFVNYIEFLVAKFYLFLQLFDNRIDFLQLILSKRTCRLDLVNF